jgi:hypothetical protein
LVTILQDWLSNPKHMIHQPIKHRWLQKLQNTPSPDQQRFTHISTVDQQSTKPKVGLHEYILI